MIADVVREVGWEGGMGWEGVIGEVVCEGGVGWEGVVSGVRWGVQMGLGGKVL